MSQGCRNDSLGEVTFKLTPQEERMVSSYKVQMVFFSQRNIFKKIKWALGACEEDEREREEMELVTWAGINFTRSLDRFYPTSVACTGGGR